MHRPIRRSAKLTAITGALTALVVLGATQELAAQTGPSPESNNDVTFTRDIAPIPVSYTHLPAHETDS